MLDNRARKIQTKTNPSNRGTKHLNIAEGQKLNLDFARAERRNPRKRNSSATDPTVVSVMKSTIAT